MKALIKSVAAAEGRGFREFLKKTFIVFIVFGAISFAAHILEKQIYPYEAFFNPVFDTLVAVAVAFFVFCLLAKERIPLIESFSVRKKEAIFFSVIALVLLAVRLSLPLMGYRKFFTAGLLAAIFLAVYGLKLGRYLAKNHWKQATAAVIVYFAVEFLFSEYILLYATAYAALLLSMASFPGVTADFAAKWPTFDVGQFHTYVSPYCSGVESMTLFATFFLLAIVYRYAVLDPRKFVKFFFIGLLGAYILAVLRLWVLLMIGAYFDPQLAMDAFHSYASVIIFGNYFFVYWFVVRDFMEKKRENQVK